jgi:hypothetical protein
VPIESVDVKDPSFTIKADGGQIVREGWPHLRVEFEDARFGEGRQYRMGGSEKFQGSTNGNRRAIITLDAGSADDQAPFGAGDNVYRVARMQEPQYVVKFDIGRMEARNLSANPAEVVPVILRTHAAAIDDDSSVGKCLVRDERVPVALDVGFFESQGNGFEEFPIVDLRFSGNVRGVRQS